MNHDLVIRGGTVVDGSGGPSREADVAIDHGRITTIGRAVGAGVDEIDARGSVVVPGFIDVHTHYDPQVLWDPALRPSSQLGVTSVIAGNCGFSIAPCPPGLRESMINTLVNVEDMRAETLHAGVSWGFETYPEYLAQVARQGTAINFGGYVGHTAVRLWVMGQAAYEREATAEEVAAMADVVAEAVRGGALGFSSDRAGFHRADGGRPVPSMVATFEELAALWTAAAHAGAAIIHVAPGENYGWVYDLQPQVGIPVTWSAILAYPEGATSKAPWADKLARHEQAIARGADVHPQVTCLPISQQVSFADPSTFYMVPAFQAVAAAARADRARLYTDPAWRQQVCTELDSGRWVDVRWDRCWLAAESTSSTLTLAELGERRGVHPLAAALDLAVADDFQTRVTISFANDDPDAVASLLAAPGCVLGLSDAGAHTGQICDAVMPVDYLAHWVRDRAIATPEAGIRRLTGELADLLGLAGRGYVRDGLAADLVVLDWDHLDQGPIRRVDDFPAGGDHLVADHPEGVRHVVVNGVPIRREHQPVDPAVRPGALLTPQASTATR